MSAVIDQKVPDPGARPEAIVIDVIVKPGDTVSVEQGLVTIETEKVTMDVLATNAALGFEADHPTLAAALRQFIDLLRNAGAGFPRGHLRRPTAGAAPPGAVPPVTPRGIPRRPPSRGRSCSLTGRLP